MKTTRRDALKTGAAMLAGLWTVNAQGEPLKEERHIGTGQGSLSCEQLTDILASEMSLGSRLWVTSTPPMVPRKPLGLTPAQAYGMSKKNLERAIKAMQGFRNPHVGEAVGDGWRCAGNVGDMWVLVLEGS